MENGWILSQKVKKASKSIKKHPKVKILYLCATQNLGKKISFFDKRIKGQLPRITSAKNINWKSIDLVFLSLPNGEAQKIANIKPKNVKLIDLSADFRLNSANKFKKWYGINHSSKYLIKKARERAVKLIEQLNWENGFFRKDIGFKIIDKWE